MASESKTTPDTMFPVNGRVLCYHGQHIYEAKVLQNQWFYEKAPLTGIIGAHYFVHYKGWKQTWDEWVPESRVLEYNDTNTALQKRLRKEASAATSAASKAPKGGAKDGGGGSARGTRKDGPRGTKRGREEDDSSKKPDLKLDLPEPLKVFLVDDWEAITKNKQLLTLPRTPNVVELLNEFANYVVDANPPHLKDPKMLMPTIVSGLVLYFERSLGANLLYRFERPQLADVKKKYRTGQEVKPGQEKDMSAVYGAEHLLRLLVSLPAKIAQSNLDPESVTLVREYVNELLQWMSNEKQRIFQHEYENATSVYISLAAS